MKKCGIVADNYKLEKFKSELNKHGFNDYSITPFIDKTSTIMVNAEDDKVVEIKKICHRVELHFKRSN